MNRVLPYLVLTVAMVCSSTAESSAQHQMRLRGVVKSYEVDMPLANVDITQNDVVLGETDSDGRYSIMADTGSELTFELCGFRDAVVKVGRKETLDVVMSRELLAIDEVVVSTKLKRQSSVVVEPTYLELDGNYLTIKTIYSIPNSRLSADSRFLLQPVLYNVTRGVKRNLRPVVIDGRNYKMVNKRYLHFGGTPDPLASYVVNRSESRGENILTYQDSIYVERAEQEDDYKVECHLMVGEYAPPPRYSDTVVMAKNTINPLRFFDNRVAAMALDESEIPQPEPDLELHDARGVANIGFEIARGEVDVDLGDNRADLEGIRALLKEIQSVEKTTIKSIKMCGYASPDGIQESNKRLADQRAKSILDFVTAEIEPALMGEISIEQMGCVEPWSRLIESAEADGDVALADKLRAIISTTRGGDSSIQQLVSRLPEYMTKIRGRYLPALRRVEYEVDYTVFRSLTVDEVRAKSRVEGATLTLWEYSQLIDSESDSLRRVAYECSALGHYPNSLIYANREAVRLIESDSINFELLRPFMGGDDLPQAVLYNQTAMFLMDHQYDEAHAMSRGVEFTPESEGLINVIKLYLSDSKVTFDYFKRAGGLNEVLILLRERSNELAYSKMRELYGRGDNSESGVMNYVMATCAARVSDLDMASHYLSLAIKIDPKLSDVAVVDGDVVDIYSKIDVKKVNN